MLPELFLGGYRLHQLERLSVHGPEVRRVREIARARGIALVLGFAEQGLGWTMRWSTPTYNSAICVDAEGSVCAVYRKTHLFGAAERATFTFTTPGDYKLCYAAGGYAFSSNYL